MFQLTNEEMLDWKLQIVISKNEKMGLRKLPLVFTEQGVAMLSSVLNSDRQCWDIFLMNFSPKLNKVK
ncbi:MAG: ORF6N domain-containing protein [Bacteroidales bacterium]|nr:ORF6N domain-containing protein [Bacteroidales bacterium]